MATPEPDPPELDLRPLTQVRSEDPEHLRAVAWCALALAWPAPVGRFRSLRRDQVHATADGCWSRPTRATWAVPGALTAWHAWEAVRAVSRPGRQPVGAAGAAPRAGPGLARSAAGSPHQALQVTFTKHARRTAQHLRATAPPSRRERVEELAAAYRELSYDSYRRLALAAGRPPVSPRGVVRAAGPRPERAPRRLSA